MEETTGKKENQLSPIPFARTPEGKRVYVAPKALVFHPDREQAKSLMGALKEESDTVALRRVAQVLSGEESDPAIVS